MAKISGTWRWHEAPSIENYRNTQWSVPFADADGTAFTSIGIFFVSELVMIYGSPTVSNSACSIGGNWRKESYREISFGDTPITVDDVFYEFLLANADQVMDAELCLIKKDTLVAIADAIRLKRGRDGGIAVSRLAEEILALPTA